MEQLNKDSKIYDNSMLSAYKECPRKYYLRYGLHWRSEGTALPLVFGLSWHSGMDIIWEHAKTVSDPDKLANYALAKFLETWEEEGLPAELDFEQIERYAPRTPLIAREMYANYIAQRWSMLQTAEVLAIEQPFAVPLPGLSGVWYVGRLDKVVQHQGEKKVIEHKTTTAYKKDGGFMTSYVDGWATDPQCIGYEYGAGLYFPGTNQVWVDAALVHKKEHHFFKFIAVSHQFSIIEEWIRDTKNWVDRVQRDWEAGHFPKNGGACMGKFGACTFIDICRSVPDNQLGKEPPPGFIVDEWKPFDLLKLEKLVNAGQ